jgi:VWFA-related protein
MRLFMMFLAGAVSLGAQAPQTPPPQFKTGIDIRLLDVVVVDRDGRPIRGLTAADFVIVEDGTPQKISTLEEVVVPDPAAPPADWMRDVPPDVGTNDIPTDGRLIVVIMDDAVTRDPELIEPARKIGREIVRGMGPSDLAAIVFTLQNEKSQDFTSDRGRLLSAVERFSVGFAPGSGLEEVLYRQYSVRAVSKASEYLRSIEGRRKTLIYVSVGVPVDWSDITSPVENLGQEGVTVGGKESMRDLGDDLQGALNESQLSNVAVYAVSPRGLTVGDNRLETEFLQTMAANTGGFAIVNTNAPETRVREIFTATSSYYLIGYEVQKPDDGRYRRLEVKVNRPGVTVHARKGYTAPRRNRRASTEKPEREISPLATAMAGFLPTGDVPMRATAIPVALPGRSEAGVAIVARVQQEAVQKRTTQQVELLTTAFDAHGKARESRRQTATVTMLPSDSSVAEYEVLSRIDLKPGRYSLRIAAHNGAIEKSGSVFFDLDVPDFKKDGLWMSGVALTSRYGLSAAPRGALADLLPVVPTTVREFLADDEVAAFFQVVQGGRRPVTPVRLELRIVDAADAVVHQANDTLEATMFSAARLAEYESHVPLDRLAPGSYLLRIDAAAGERTARREIRFTRK